MDNDEAIRHVRRTWAYASGNKEIFARSFYSELFRIAPETERLFQSDMQVQGLKLTETLDFIVDHLEEPDVLLPAARDLAIRHVSYGVAKEHYAFVGQALITSMASMMGSAFDDKAEAAWTAAYTGLADHMVTSAY